MSVSGSESVVNYHLAIQLMKWVYKPINQITHTVIMQIGQVNPWLEQVRTGNLIFPWVRFGVQYGPFKRPCQIWVSLFLTNPWIKQVSNNQTLNVLTCFIFSQKSHDVETLKPFIVQPIAMFGYEEWVLFSCRLELN